MPSTLVQKNKIYEECTHIRRTKPDYHIEASVLKDIGTNFRTIPTFESSLYDHVYLKRYSFAKNERLNCCWKQYVRNIETRVFQPFEFPHIRHIHIRNNALEFVPSESRYQFDNRMKLKPGPGVDIRGQMPIPQELLMKRGGNIKPQDKMKPLKRVKSSMNLLASKNKMK